VEGAHDSRKGHAEGVARGQLRRVWGIAMHDEGRDEFTITEYQRYWNESERQAYRRQVEFRELWREYETPNELRVFPAICEWSVPGSNRRPPACKDD
jgi:hypothetical protein